MAKDKLRMSNKRFMAIMIPVGVFLLALIIVAVCVMNSFAPVMDAFFGRGKRHIANVEGTENWDTNYYDVKYKSYDESIKAATQNAKKVTDEGFVLMKNDAPAGKEKSLLPLEPKATVTPLGMRYDEAVYGIYGSGSPHDGMGMKMYFGSVVYDDNYKVTNPCSVDIPEALDAEFTVNKAPFEKMKASEWEVIGEADGTIPCKEIDSINGCAGSNTFLYEYNPSIYAGTEASCANSVGLVFIGRDASEGGDLKLDGYTDGTPHELALSKNERDTVKFAKQNCTGGVVAIINSCNPMELGVLMSGELEVDAIVWIGFPGSNGAESLADILCGKVNPSGRTADIWVSNLMNDPTYKNYGSYIYSSAEVANSKAIGTSFVEYEEGVYVGYRYYETAAVMDGSFDYDKAVVFPFGYGLSYTEFEQKITSFDTFGDDITVKVTVTNKGAVDGKDVVQLYYTAPYTQWDIDKKIEKPVKNLVAFAKTDIIKGGQSEEVTLTFSKEDMASYCYTRENKNGTKGAYVLESGDYTVTLGKNSHEEWDKKTVHINEEWFDESNPRRSEKNGQSKLDDEGNPMGVTAVGGDLDFIAASNLFEDSNTYMNSSNVTLLSRADWKNTQPTTPTGDSFKAPKAVCDTIDAYSRDTFDYKADKLLGNVEGSAIYKATAPTSKAQNGLTVADMRGLDYYDESWELLLDQIDYSKTEEINKLLYGGAYGLGALDSIGLPATSSAEGPAGIGLFAHLFYGDTRLTKIPKMCGYAANTVLASTFNEELAYLTGASVGQEAYWFRKEGETTYLNGWTGPAMNLHRNAFCGRNAEYYSEDPVLAGAMGRNEISGAGDNGLYTIFKHFAINNIETAKTAGDGICTWATEQTMREIYFKVFEDVFKNSRREVKYIADDNGTVKTRVVRGATAVMTSFNRVGAIPAGSNYALITELLKNEWGFQGFVQSDMPSQSNKDQMLRAGGAVEMNSSVSVAEDLSSPTAQWQIRRAVHDIAFAVANSNAMQGAAPGAIIYYDMSPWAIGLIIAGVIIGLIDAAIIVLIVLRVLDAKKHPENYRQNQKV